MHWSTWLFIGVNSFTIYDIRLGSSSTSPARSGRVDVLTQRGWLPLCSSNWGTSESIVLCRQLGYVYSSYSETWILSLYYHFACILYHINFIGRSSLSATTLRYSFYCSGSESSISQCSYSFSYEQQSCSYINTVYCTSCRLNQYTLERTFIANKSLLSVYIAPPPWLSIILYWWGWGLTQN